MTGKRIRHVETDLRLYKIHRNSRFVLLMTKDELIMYDMEELQNESIKDADLWSRRLLK